MQASPFLLPASINLQVVADTNLKKDSSGPKLDSDLPTVENEGKISRPVKKRPYTEPIISRRPQKDRLEIW